MEVELWENHQGISPVGDFIEGQSIKAKKKIIWVIEQLEDKGIMLLYYTDHMKKLHGHKMFQLSTRYDKTFFRILFVIKRETAWLLHAFKKKTNHTSLKEIKIALNRAKLLEIKLINEV